MEGANNGDGIAWLTTPDNGSFSVKACICEFRISILADLIDLLFLLNPCDLFQTESFFGEWCCLFLLNFV